MEIPWQGGRGTGLLGEEGRVIKPAMANLPSRMLYKNQTFFFFLKKSPTRFHSHLKPAAGIQRSFLDRVCRLPLALKYCEIPNSGQVSTGQPPRVRQLRVWHLSSAMTSCRCPPGQGKFLLR